MQANAMLTMIILNMCFQILFVFGQYQKKNWKMKLKEMLICILFLRPSVDAYRVSTNHEDSEATIEPLIEMIVNKVRSFNL